MTTVREFKDDLNRNIRRILVPMTPDQIVQYFRVEQEMTLQRVGDKYRVRFADGYAEQREVSSLDEAIDAATDMIAERGLDEALAGGFIR